MLGAGSADTCSWGSLRRHHVMGITELLRDTGRATATVNTYLGPQGGGERSLDAPAHGCESFQHIRAVRNLRGSRLPSGRALPCGEIRALFAVCEADRSCLGARDAAMLAVILGCGLRRSEVVSLICVTLSLRTVRLECWVREQGATGICPGRCLAAAADLDR
jgi:integrase